MILNYDISNKIIYYIFIYHYKKLNLIKNTSNIFYNISKFIINKYDISEKLYIASFIKYWRPELEQIPYIFGNFKIISELKRHTLFNWYNKFTYNTSYFSYNYIQPSFLLINTKETYTYNNYICLDEKNMYLDIEKPLFKIYFIYYLYDIHNNSYSIKILILPYYDERITQKENFLHYLLIDNIDKTYNHNIKKIGKITF
tara:strand:+ start:405 stop:1004 length:600 start_codon:yes stop_codon:yes gene_type:complete